MCKILDMQKKVIGETGDVWETGFVISFFFHFIIKINGIKPLHNRRQY